MKLTLIFSFAMVFVVACGQQMSSNVAINPVNAASPSIPTTTVPLVLDETTIARNLYTTNCMTCHRDSGRGGKTTVDGKQINPDDLTSSKMKGKTDEKLYSLIADGVPDEGMPAFKDQLSAEQINAMVKHLRVLQK